MSTSAILDREISAIKDVLADHPVFGRLFPKFNPDYATEDYYDRHPVSVATPTVLMSKELITRFINDYFSVDIKTSFDTIQNVQKKRLS